MTPKEQERKPQVKVVDSKDFGDNYPSSVESAKKQLEEKLASYLKGGWVYSGIIQRNIGAAPRDYYVFYKI